MAITAEMTTSVMELYTAYFNRAADEDGVDYWLNEMDTNGWTIDTVAQSFADQTEYTALYAGLTNAEIVAQVYTNVLNRTADAEGAAYWESELDSGLVPVNQFIQAVVNAATEEVDGVAVHATDKAIVDNKSAVSQYYYDLGLNVTDVSLASITDDVATVDAAKIVANDTAASEGGQTYTVVAASTSVVEGNSINFTVGLGLEVSTDTVVNYQIQGVEVAGGTATPVADLGILNGTVTIPAGSTSATITLTPSDDSVTEGYEGFKVVLLDSSFAEIASSGNVAIEDPENAGQSFTLTTGVDAAPAFTGGAGDDIYTASDTTLTALDALDGGAGTDVLNIANSAAAALAMPAGVTVANIETLNVRSADDIGVVGGAAFDVSGFTGLTTFNATQSVDIAVTAAATTDVNVSNASGNIEIEDGNSVTITDDTASTDIIVNGAVGAITVTDTDNSGTAGTDDITIDGGTTVTVTATADAATGNIEIGTTTQATGAVVVTQNMTAADTSAAADGDIALGTIDVTGGTTITVDVNVTATDGIDDTDDVTATVGAITVVGDTSTTEVTVSQTAAQTAADAVTGVTGVNAVEKVVFATLANAAAVKIGGLTLTNDTGANMAAAQVAAAFANLAATTTQGCSTVGTYSGAWAGEWSSSAVVTTATETYVLFTGPATTFNDGVAGDLYVDTDGTVSADDDTDSTVSTAGVTAVVASAGQGGIVNGAVLIDDNTTATATITTITVDGYGAVSKIGVTSDATTALSSLTLKNAGADIDMVVADTAATLALAVENLGTSTDTDEAVVTFTAAPTTLNVTATGNNYIDLTAAATTTLTVAGTGLLNIADTDLDAVTTITVTGSASLTTATAIADTLTSVVTTGTTGTVTMTIGGDTATYTGGAGVDAVTLDATTVNKAISLGAGDDSLTLASGTTAATSAVSGGDGTDTLVMVAADAVTADNSAAFATAVTGFERVTITGATGAQAINLAALGAYNYVTVAGLTDDDASTSTAFALNNIASNGTVVISDALSADAAADTFSVNVTDAATTVASLNLVISNAATIAVGDITVADVETINITSTDADTTVSAVHTLELTAAAATAVTVTGNAGLGLTLTGSAAVTSINASTMTGALTVDTAVSTAAVTVTGGTGADNLTASNASDVLVGGAGDDTLIVAADLVTLTGGTGIDTFDVGTATSNVNSYATITDIASGDIINFSAAADFTSAAITLGDTAIFQDFANAAINNSSATDVSWFQYSGNTYIIENVAGGTSFTNGTDVVVKLSGLVDLSTASFNSAAADGFIQIC